MPDTAQVAIVGAGPVGMTAAALLAARGVSVVVLERNARTSAEPKAISIDDEALRTFESAGLLERVLRIIVPGTGTRYFDASGEPLFQARSPQPYRLGHPFKNPFAQPELERRLAEHLRAAPEVTLRMSTEVADVRQDASGVEAGCADGTRVRARYLFGCDGGRSPVREQLGVGMTGRSFAEVWLVADVLDDPHDQRYGMHHADPSRPHVIVPGRGGRCRYEFLLHPGEGEAGDRPPFALLQTLLAPFRTIRPDQVERMVDYRFHALVADRFRVGNTFLLGDAAHMMPPFAGQGLNSGIRDAANLAWKVADVLDGRLDDAALNSYERERKPHAEATVALSARLGRIVMTTDDRLARRRDRLLRRILGRADGRAYLEEMRYRPVARHRAGLVVPDDRVPAGRVFGQPRVFDLDAMTALPLDHVLGNGWALLGVGVEPDELIAASCATAPLDPVVVQVPVDDRLPRDPGAGRILLDVDGGLDAEVAPYRGRCVLLRPDRFVAASWPPGAVPDLAGSLQWARSTDPLLAAG